MKKHVNYYETLAEAVMRLDKTVVLYDGEPYFVLCITDHKGDGIFRMYLDPLNVMYSQQEAVPYEWHDEPGSLRGDKMDKFLEKFPDCGIIRKMMNSPLFNRFQPFPLGMFNTPHGVHYLERTPARSTYQGLKERMVASTELRLDKVKEAGMGRVSLVSPEFRSTILGLYPSFDECLTNLNDPDVTNTAVAFDREFVLHRGPMGIMFIGYKRDVVGFLPNSDRSLVTLGREFGHLREVVLALNIFDNVTVK